MTVPAASTAVSGSDWWVLRSPGGLIAWRLSRRVLWILLGLVLAMVALVAVSLTQGSYDLSVREVISALLGEAAEDRRALIVWEFRFPRTLAALLVGAMLALSGAALQHATRNGLADPSLVGVSQGAGLAVVILTVALPQVSGLLRPWAAFGGALLVAALIQALSWNRRTGGSSIRFILMGIGIAAFISAMTNALMTYGEINRVMSALAWLSGSIHVADWADVRMLTLWSLVLLPSLLLISRSVSAWQMGVDAAVGLGVRTRWIRHALIVNAVGFAAIATAAVGPMGFVGLVAPHAARRLARSGVALHLLLSACLGALLVGLADLAGRTLFAPVQIPAGLITAVIGAPVFLYLMYRHHRQQQGG